jgi:hypothetical protein
MNTYAVSIQWADGLSMSVIEAENAQHALGVAIANNLHSRYPITTFIVANLHDTSDQLKPEHP